MHVARAELDQLLIDEWNIQTITERVCEIDFSNKIVTTDLNSYRYRNQVIDCSGSKMVVASILNQKVKLWPSYSIWGYFNVVQNKPSKFWEEITSQDYQYRRFELGEENALMNAMEDDDSYPSKVTIIKKISKGHMDVANSVI